MLIISGCGTDSTLRYLILKPLFLLLVCSYIAMFRVVTLGISSMESTLLKRDSNGLLVSLVEAPFLTRIGIGFGVSKPQRKSKLWSEWHDSNPTLQNLNRRGMSSTASRCGYEEESFLHVVRDCATAIQFCNKLWFSDHTFFMTGSSQQWLKSGVCGSKAPLFLDGVWFAWIVRNSMCIAKESISMVKAVFEA